MSHDTRAYYRSLDGMRGVGMVFVVTYHFLLLSDFAWSTIGFSWIWIQMFFVQSGFLITRSLISEREAPLPSYLGRFYWRRILRIFPIYFGYIALATLLYLVADIPAELGRRLPYLLSFTYNFADASREIVHVNLWFIHFWSLSAEEQFYLVWPLLLFFIPQARSRWMLVAIILAAPLFRYGLVERLVATGTPAELAGRMAYTNTLGQLDAFAFGAAIPIFQLQDRVRYPGRWTLMLIAVALVVGVCNYFSITGQGISLSWTSFGFSGGMTQNFQHVWSYSIVNMLVMFAILYVTNDRYWGIFHNRMFVRIGKIVYGMYVIHMAVLIAADKINETFVHNLTLMLVVGFAVTFLLADLSYRHYEKRFLAMKNSPPRMPRWLGGQY